MAAARAVAAGARKRHAALILTPAEKVRGKKRVKNPWTQFLADVSQAKKVTRFVKAFPHDRLHTLSHLGCVCENHATHSLQTFTGQTGCCR